MLLSAMRTGENLFSPFIFLPSDGGVMRGLSDLKREPCADFGIAVATRPSSLRRGVRSRLRLVGWSRSDVMDAGDWGPRKLGSARGCYEKGEESRVVI